MATHYDYEWRNFNRGNTLASCITEIISWWQGTTDRQPDGHGARCVYALSPTSGRPESIPHQLPRSRSNSRRYPHIERHNYHQRRPASRCGGGEGGEGGANAMSRTAHQNWLESAEMCTQFLPVFCNVHATRYEHSDLQLLARSFVFSLLKECKQNQETYTQNVSIKHDSRTLQKHYLTYM
jgi:hypothetical protein